MHWCDLGEVEVQFWKNVAHQDETVVRGKLVGSNQNCLFSCLNCTQERDVRCMYQATCDACARTTEMSAGNVHEDAWQYCMPTMMRFHLPRCHAAPNHQQAALLWAVRFARQYEQLLMPKLGHDITLLQSDDQVTQSVTCHVHTVHAAVSCDHRRKQNFQRRGCSHSLSCRAGCLHAITIITMSLPFAFISSISTPHCTSAQSRWAAGRRFQFLFHATLCLECISKIVAVHTKSCVAVTSAICCLRTYNKLFHHLKPRVCSACMSSAGMPRSVATASHRS
jgi:hypothetical protein